MTTPKTDKTGLINWLEMLRSLCTDHPNDAQVMIDDIIDALLPARVTFSYGVDQAEEKESIRKNIAAFAANNPSMVD